MATVTIDKKDLLTKFRLNDKSENAQRFNKIETEMEKTVKQKENFETPVVENSKTIYDNAELSALERKK
jgi:hypothetical protein